MTDLDGLLQRTSRTFGLAIPLLPEPLRLEVTISYLLFRIADTFEDASPWRKSDRLEALASFASIVDRLDVTRASSVQADWLSRRPTDHDGYLELLSETPAVIRALADLPAARRATIVRHTVRTVEGMQQVVSRADTKGAVQLRDRADLEEYCYTVAGIVGELLTELFVSGVTLSPDVAGEMTRNARAFGEALQLVNILKDASADAEEGRVFIPPTMTRAEVVSMARADLDGARSYVLAMQRGGAPRGCVEFVALPALLARATLSQIERDPDGTGTKVGREVVMGLLAQLRATLDRGEPAIV